MKNMRNALFKIFFSPITPVVVVRLIFILFINVFGYVDFASARDISVRENDVIYDVNKLLPSSVLEFTAGLKFQTKQLNKLRVNYCQEITKNTVFAFFNPFLKSITLDTDLLDSFYNCQDKLKITLQKTIIHEYLHAYDSMNRKLSRKRISSPKKFSLKLEPKRITESEVFKTFAMIQGRTSDNFTGSRLYTPYELKDIDEFAATNFEGFILEKDYKCRRPSMYKFYSEHFSFFPYEDYLCETTDLIYVQKNISQRFNLDHKKIYQIHYLHASEGSDFIGGFGHSMVRIVMCENEQNRGAHCLADQAQDIVLSFRGNVASLKIDPYAGIKGDYPSILFAFSFDEIKSEYNKKELRDLISYPLNFSRSQIISFSKRALELFWDYSGRYKFLTNNCASETFKFITGTDSNFISGLKSITPNGVLNDLFQLGLIHTKYRNRDNLKNERLFYKSHYHNIQLALEKISRKDISKSQFIEIAKNDPLYFTHYIEKAKVQQHVSTKVYLAALYILNRHVRFIYYQNLQRDYQEKLVKFIDKHPEINKDVRAALTLFNPRLDSNSYGIPTQAEVNRIEWVKPQSYNEDLSIIDQFQTDLNYKEEIKIVNELINTLDRIMKIKMELY